MVTRRTSVFDGVLDRVQRECRLRDLPPDVRMALDSYLRHNPSAAQRLLPSAHDSERHLRDVVDWARDVWHLCAAQGNIRGMLEELIIAGVDVKQLRAATLARSDAERRRTPRRVQALLVSPLVAE